MIDVVPLGYLQRNYSLLISGKQVIELRTNLMLAGGHFIHDGEAYQLYRNHVVWGNFVLRCRGSTLATATKLSFLGSDFLIHHSDAEYQMRYSGREGDFVVGLGDEPIGTVRRKSSWTRRDQIALDLPESWGLPLQTFVLWLALSMWQQQDSS